MHNETELLTLGRWLQTLTVVERVAFVTQLDTLVCDALATVPKHEHLYGHAVAEWLTGERPDEPSAAELSEAAAERVRRIVYQVGLALRLAFTVPVVHAHSAAGACETVIVMARRRGQVYDG